MSTEPCASNFFVWNTKSQVTLALLGTAGLATLVTGVVLAVLYKHGVSSTILLTTGGVVLAGDLIYLLVSKCTHMRDERHSIEINQAVKDKWGFFPEKPTHADKVQFSRFANDLNRQIRNYPEAEAFFRKVIGNLQKIDKQPNKKLRWNCEEIEDLLGLSESEVKLLFKIAEVPFGGRGIITDSDRLVSCCHALSRMTGLYLV